MEPSLETAYLRHLVSIYKQCLRIMQLPGFADSRQREKVQTIAIYTKNLIANHTDSLAHWTNDPQILEITVNHIIDDLDNPINNRHLRN